jgi:hypothetical protein
VGPTFPEHGRGITREIARPVLPQRPTQKINRRGPNFYEEDIRFHISNVIRPGPHLIFEAPSIVITIEPKRTSKAGCAGLDNSYWSHAMPSFEPQIVQAMRNALEEVMTKVPMEYSTASTKAYLAECILKAAAQGQTSYDGLVAAASDQIQAALSLLA